VFLVLLLLAIVLFVLLLAIVLLVLLLAIVLLVLLLAIALLGLLLLARFTDSHYLFGIFKLFLSKFREIFTIFRQFYFSIK
jgi:hypothetical protein